MGIGVSDKGEDIEVRSGSLDTVKRIKDTVKANIVSGEVIAKIGTIDVIKSGSVEQTNFTESRSATIAADNVGLMKTADQPLDVSSASIPVEQPVTVDATDLDIRSLTTSDSIDIGSNTVGLFEAADFTETRSATIAADNVGLLKGGGTAVTDVGSGTRPTSLDVDNIGLFKTTDFTETRTIQTDNVGLMKDSTFTETRSATIAADNVGLLKEGGTISQSGIYGIDAGGTVHQIRTNAGGILDVRNLTTSDSIDIGSNSVGLFEAADFTETRSATISADNVGLAKDTTLTSGTINAVSKIVNSVTSDVGSGTRPTSVDVDNVGLFKSGQDIGNAGTVSEVSSIANVVSINDNGGTITTGLDVDNVGLFKTADFTETRSATISADNVGLLKGGGTVSQANVYGVDEGGTVHTVLTDTSGRPSIEIGAASIMTPSDVQAQVINDQEFGTLQVTGTQTTQAGTVDTKGRVGVHIMPGGTVQAVVQASWDGTTWNPVDKYNPLATTSSDKFYDLGPLPTQRVRIKYINQDASSTVPVETTIERQTM